MAKPIAEMWESFERDVIPRDAGKGQRREMRRAFYAGARIVLCGIEALSRPEISEEAGVRLIADMNAECEEFARLIGADF